MAEEIITFDSLVRTVVGQYNDIFDALISKGVKYQSSSVTSGSIIPTSEYASLIKNYTFGIQGHQKNGDIGQDIISYYNYTSSIPDVLSSGIGLTWNTARTALTFTGHLTNNNAYFAGTHFSATIPDSYYIDYNFDSTGANVTLSNNTYTVKVGSDSKILRSVNIAKGAVTVSQATSTSDASTAALTSSVTGIGAKLTLSQNESSEDFATITLNNSISLSGTISNVLTFTNTAGYVKSSDISVPSFSHTISKTVTPDAQIIYIPKGTVSINASSISTLDITGSDSLLLETTIPAGESNNYLYVTANLDSSNLTANVTAGYIGTSTSLSVGTIDSQNITRYIKKAEITPTEIGLSYTITDSGNIVSSTSANSYAVLVTTSKQNNTGKVTITKGYNTSLTSSAVSLANETQEKVIYIKKGSVTSTLSSSVTAEGSVISTTATSHAITITTTATNTITKTEGYIKNNDVTNTTSPLTEETTIYVKDGIVSTPSASLTAEIVNADDNLNPSSGTPAINLFVDTAPASGDYYKISTVPTVSYSAGYISDGVDIGDTVYKYIPKATFEYVTDSSSSNFLQVKSGGYVPAGALVDIAEISGNIDYAKMGVSIAGISTTSNANAGYELSVSKDFSSTSEYSVGYIDSSTNGLFQISSGTSYIKKGSVTNTVQVGDIECGDAVKDGSNYIVHMTGSLQSVVSIAEGYIKELDNIHTSAPIGSTITSNAATLSKTISSSFSEDLELPVGVLDFSVTSDTVSINNASDVVGPDSGGDSVSLVLDFDATVSTDVEEEGYVTAADGGSDTVTNQYTIDIKKGSIASDPNLTRNITLDGVVDEDFRYTATATITTTNAITSGYIEEDGTKSDTITLNLSETLDAAEITISSPSLTTSISTNGIITYNNSNSASEFVSININSSANTGDVYLQQIGYLLNDPDRDDPGYINPDQVNYSSGSTTSATVYIKTLGLGTTTPTEGYGTTTASSTDVDSQGNIVTSPSMVYYAGTIGSQTGDIDEGNSIAKTNDTVNTTGLRQVMYVDTSEKYAKYDTKVELSPNAMGSAVVSQMQTLRNRLNGIVISV